MVMALPGGRVCVPVTGGLAALQREVSMQAQGQPRSVLSLVISLSKL